MLGKGTVKKRDGTQLEIVEWHPFPQDQPPKTGSYMVTYESGGINFRYFNKESDTKGEFTVYHAKVIAWAERPRGYGKEKK